MMTKYGTVFLEKTFEPMGLLGNLNLCYDGEYFHANEYNMMNDTAQFKSHFQTGSLCCIMPK